MEKLILRVFDKSFLTYLATFLWNFRVIETFSTERDGFKVGF